VIKKGDIVEVSFANSLALTECEYEEGEMKKETFGAAIRRIRLEKGLKAMVLAGKVGINPVYITQIEKHNKLPGLKVARNIIWELAPGKKERGILLKQYIDEKYPEIRAILEGEG
jgi:DNA-binding XRE family transcriptional regulator